ncbi:hypothetical protein DM01DRAFT_1339373 [Hesseltinella vesiculosa]|uniref:WRKY domain-containing protein n=1 Tax=Hesseltinella vesiculosa TaxID=101127 RepID=A0A1X2G6W3_9FUNG|nr:hypothetical protein DM01DRAFT_1339373 [Hesseltinella vesiculosa]
MTDLPTCPKNPSQGIPLYHHEQVPFTLVQSSRPSNAAPRSSTNVSSPPMSYELQDLLVHYHSQPDLLRLILSSKLEEDKRRAEEAKLRSRELDLLLLQQQQQLMPSLTNSPSSSTSTHSTHAYSSLFTSKLDNPPASLQPQDTSAFDVSLQKHFQPATQPQPTESNFSTLSSPPLTSSDDPLYSRHVPSSSSSFVAKDESYVVPSDASDFLPSAPSRPSNLNVYSHAPPYTPTTRPIQHTSMDNEPFTSTLRYDPYAYPTRPRRRREMQAITKIVETREYPYVDGYNWRNNGNTIQKKTGNKSVYYKCANSIKGCTVNKTLTWRGSGEYIIKYRGEHLPDCAQAQRVAQP